MTVDFETLLRFERGDLTGAEAADVRAQLALDPALRVDLDWVVALRTATRRGALEGQGAGVTPTPDDVAALAEGTLGAERAVEIRAQLTRCDDGFGMLSAALEELGAERSERSKRGKSAPHTAQRGPWAWAGRPQLLAAAALVALSALAWRMTPRPSQDPAEPSRSLQQPALALVDRTPLPVPDLRSRPDSAALAAYRSGAYIKAVRELRSATEQAPDDGQVWLYLGSAYLILGRDVEALEALGVALETCTGSYAVEARWQLAQARLAAGDTDGARTLLHQVSTGRHAGAARELLGKL